MSESTTQDQFETWYKEITKSAYDEPDLGKNPEGEYFDTNCQRYWDCWQASRSYFHTIVIQPILEELVSTGVPPQTELKNAIAKAKGTPVSDEKSIRIGLGYETGKAAFAAAAEPRKFQIWAEGYCTTGDSGKAYYFGEVHGKDFKEACDEFFRGKPTGWYNPEKMTHWGCRLFDNEQDARRSFG